MVLKNPSITFEVVPVNKVIILWNFLMFAQIFLSPKVKQSMIIGNKHGIYELSHELPNDLRLRIIGN